MRWAVVVMVVMAGLLAPQSRGGVSAFALAALLLPLAARRRRRTALGVALLVGLGAFWIGVGGVLSGFATRGIQASRLDLWRDMLPMVPRFPVFGVFGDGGYRLQPIFVDDLAQLAVEASFSSENVVRDEIGPETFTYRELVSAIGAAIGKRRPIVGIPPGLGVAIGRLVGLVVRDVVVTPEEVAGLMQNRLVTSSPPAGTTRCPGGSWSTGPISAAGTPASSLAGETGGEPTRNCA